MGLESYKDNIELNSSSNAGENPKYDKETLIKSLREFKEEHGSLTRAAFDENDNYPSSSPVRRVFGSWNNGVQEALDEVTQEQRKEINQWEGYYSILKAVEEYGENITASEFDSDSKYISRKGLKSATGMKFNDVKRHLGIDVNQEKDIDKDRIKSELSELEEPITTEKINEECTFSHKVVNNIGGGSMTRGLKKLGFNVTRKQERMSPFKSSNSASKARKTLSEFECYSGELDAYIYILECTASDGSVWYYVGQSDENSSIERRISDHIRLGGDFNKPIEIENIDLYYLKNVESNNLNDMERKYSFRIAIKEHTDNVLGGK